jgi:hypothetical protein
VRFKWPDGEAEPAKYWFSNQPQRTPLQRLVRVAKARWWIERDDQELTRSSSKSSALATTRAATGAVFIIMEACASQPTAF